MNPSEIIAHAGDLQRVIEAFPADADPVVLEALHVALAGMLGLVTNNEGSPIQPMGEARAALLPPTQDDGAPPRTPPRTPLQPTSLSYVPPDPRMPAHSLCARGLEGVTVRTPKGKLLKASEVKDAECRMQKRKEPTFDSSYKFDTKKGFRITIKSIYDRLYRTGVSYVFNLAEEAYEEDKKAHAFDIADERSVLKIDGETVHDLDQAIVFDWLQQAFSDKYPEIFLSIKSSDYLCGTIAYDKLRRKLNPINPRIQIDKKNRFKQWISLPFNTTWEDHEHLLVKYRHDLQAANADVKPFKIMYLTVDALRKTGGHWTTFMENNKIQQFVDMNAENFTEDDLSSFFQALQQREYSLLGDTKAAQQRGKRTADTSESEQICVASHFQYCSFHKKDVAHSEADCSLNPKNKGKAPPASTEGGKAGLGLSPSSNESEGEEGDSLPGAEAGLFANVVCYKCKKKGHIKANCPDMNAPVYAAFMIHELEVSLDAPHLSIGSAPCSITPRGLLYARAAGALAGDCPGPLAEPPEGLVDVERSVEGQWGFYPNPFDPKLMQRGGWRREQLEGPPPPNFFERIEAIDRKVTSGFFLDNPDGYSPHLDLGNTPNDHEDDYDTVPDLIDSQSSDDEQDLIYMDVVDFDEFAGRTDVLGEIIADGGATINLLQDFDDPDPPRDAIEAIFVRPALTEEGLVGSTLNQFIESSWNDLITSDLPGISNSITDFDIDKAIAQTKTLPLSIKSPMEYEIKGARIDDDSTLRDDYWAPDFNGGKVIEWYKRINTIYHGTVMDVELKPNNKLKIDTRALHAY